jgi:hypothetical protein
MLSIRVGEDVYGLDDSSSAELIRRLELASPTPPAGAPEPGSTLDKLRDAAESEEPAQLDDGDLALIGVVLEAWMVEVDGDLPADVLELRYAISARFE